MRIRIVPVSRLLWNVLCLLGKLPWDTSITPPELVGVVDVAESPSLSDDVRERLISLARKRITEEGVLIIDARRFRTQAANRQDAIERLMDLVRKAAQEPQIRRKTRLTLASKTRRLESKRRRAATKLSRRPMPGPTDG